MSNLQGCKRYPYLFSFNVVHCYMWVICKSISWIYAAETMREIVRINLIWIQKKNLKDFESDIQLFQIMSTVPLI